ncbi:MAG: cupredoxin domain-containing protein [Actinomycetota bacterium]
MRRALVIAASFSLLIGAAAPSKAAVAAAGPAGFAVGFLTPVVVMPEGDGITFANSDVAPHNFIATDAFVPKKKAKKVKWCSAYDKGKCPLFWSETITASQTTEVQGLDAVTSGEQYGFYCSIHPGMKGTLIVP